MNISRTSWHYRLYRYITNIPQGPRYLNPRFSPGTRTDPNLPKSLCPYAWSIFLGLIGALVIVTIVLIGSIIVLPIVFAMKTGRQIDARFGTAVRKMKNREKESKPPEPPKPKREPLLRTYLKARKDRVCPPIKLVD